MNTTFKFGNFEHEFNTADWRTTEKHEKAQAALVAAINGRQKNQPPSVFQKLFVESVIQTFEILFDDVPDVANQLFGDCVDMMLATDALDALASLVREQDAIMAERMNAFAGRTASTPTIPEHIHSLSLPGKPALQ